MDGLWASKARLNINDAVFAEIRGIEGLLKPEQIVSECVRCE